MWRKFERNLKEMHSSTIHKMYVTMSDVGAAVSSSSSLDVDLSVEPRLHSEDISVHTGIFRASTAVTPAHNT